MSDEKYHTVLEQLQEADPTNPLLRFLKSGPSVQNWLLLKRAIAKVREKPEPLSDQEADDQDESTDPVQDETLRLMRVDLRKLFTERNILSDRFHELKSVDMRRGNSEEIQIIQRNIERLMKNIRHYKIHGQMPEGGRSKYYVPKDGLELAKRMNSLRANISRKKREIEQLRENIKGPEDERKLEAELNKLADLQTQKSNVEQKIKDL